MENNSKKYLNTLNLITTFKKGKARREEILNDILSNGTPLPNPVVYEDIDDEFKSWVVNNLYITYEGRELPTMSLFSNQRFSEYSQTWSYTDDDNNILMNFKTITRENNPQQGKNQDGYWNIPGGRYYLMSRQKILDKNGTESILDYKMKQPFCVDLVYEVNIFTNKYELINEFNLKVNDAFKARQVYIAPNGHYMPMTLESISDESEYRIDDRQFFSQSYKIRVMAYIITENDFKIEELPLRSSISFINDKNNKPIAEISEAPLINNGKEDFDYYKSISLSIKYPVCSDICKFVIDTDMKITDIEYDNVKNNIQLYINDEEIFTLKTIFRNGDEIKIKINRYYKEKESSLTLFGYDPNIYD